MRFLVVDNTTHLLPRLIEFLPGEVDVLRFDALSEVDPTHYDAIIFSGGSDIPVLGNEALFAHEMKWSREAPAPIIGICLGAEIIARAYGADLKRMDDRERGAVNIVVCEPNECFQGKTSFYAYENHHWVIADLPETLIPMARSSHGVEIFRHATLPIFAFQYHPESPLAGNEEGGAVFLSVLSSLVGVRV